MASPLEWGRRAAYRLSTAFRSATLGRELDDEMAFHRELLQRDLQHDGATADEARLAALRRFGNPLALRERSGDAWGLPRLEQLGQDIRYGARALRKSPAFAAVAIGAVGIAMGINTGFFSLVDAFVWRPLPVAHPEHLVRVQPVDARGVGSIRLSYPMLTALATRSRTLTDVAGYVAQPVAMRTAATANSVAAAAGCVTANYFVTLGGGAALGRVLAAADARDDATPAIVLSDPFWTRAYNRSPNVVGRDAVVNGVHVMIVGVARADFVGLNPLVPDFWITLRQGERVGATPGRLLDPANRFIVVHARLRDDVSVPQAEGEVSGLLADPPAPPGTRESVSRIVGARLQPSASMLPPDSNTMLLLAPALFVVALILVIACANLANLLLSRGLARQREIAVRLALGASRGRLIQQLLTESVLVALLGGALGYLLGTWTLTIASRSFFSFVPATFGTLALSLHSSWRVVAYTVALAAASTLVFGLAPALSATTPNLGSELKGDDGLFASGIRRSRLRDGLVAIQVAASVILLVAGVTLVQSLHEFGSNTTGLSPEPVTVATLGLATTGHLTSTLARERETFAERAALLSNVGGTARAAATPFTQWPTVRLGPAGARSTFRGFYVNRVTPGYFGVVGQRIVQGRTFTAADSSSGAQMPVIVTQAAAHTLWPDGSAVGRLVSVERGADSINAVARVVGVAADAHSEMIWDADDNGYVYFPATSADLAALDMPLLVRVTGRAETVPRTLQDLAEAIDPNEPLHIDRLAETHRQELVPFQYGAAVTTSVGLLGLGLALIGLYGVVAFAVRRRQREIAVRIALGAGPREVLGVVLRREVRLVLVGLAIGLIISLGEGRLIASLTLTMSPLGAVSLGGVILLVFAVAVAAMIVPAAGALRIAPMQVLREE